MKSCFDFFVFFSWRNHLCLHSIEIDTNIDVIVASPTTSGAYQSPRRSLSLWWASQVIGDVIMTESSCQLLLYYLKQN